MKKLIVTIGMALVLCFSVGCFGKKDVLPADLLAKQQGLVVEQRAILNCGAEYFDCLDDIKISKDNILIFEAEVSKCVAVANSCPDTTEGDE